MNPVSSKYDSGCSDACALYKELMSLRDKRKEEDMVIEEVRSIIRRSMIYSKQVLQNLDLYQQTYQMLDDEEIDHQFVFTANEIEKVAIKYRMCFLDIVYFKKEIPTVAEIKIEYLNEIYCKQLSGFKILSYRECFTHSNSKKNYGILFVPTLNGHYYLIHQWGDPVPVARKWLYFPLQNFETLAVSLMVFTLLVDLILPTRLITLDRTATYWSGYRVGVYFHLLIFFGGLSVFFIVGFFKNVSKNIWNTT